MLNLKTATFTIGLMLGIAQQSFCQQATIDKQAASDKAAARSQAKIDTYDDQRQAALQRYRAAIARAESLRVYNQQLRRLVDSQQADIISIERQTKEIETIETGALPLMISMTRTLEKIVAADAPFLQQERQRRVEQLRNMIDRADVTVGEKYRRIMEAYMVEVDYGRTIEAYQGELASEGDTRSVDFLRLGRVGLYYQTLDGKETGRWSAQQRGWQVLSGGTYRKSVRDGLRVARKQAPPSLLTLPIDAPEAD